jgi:hypothetical protein
MWRRGQCTWWWHLASIISNCDDQDLLMITYNTLLYQMYSY